MFYLTFELIWRKLSKYWEWQCNRQRLQIYSYGTTRKFPILCICSTRQTLMKWKLWKMLPYRMKTPPQMQTTIPTNWEVIAYKSRSVFIREVEILKVYAYVYGTYTCTILTRTRTRFLYSICSDFHNLPKKRVTLRYKFYFIF